MKTLLGVFIKIIHCRNFMVNLQQVFMFPPLLFCTAWSHLCPSMTSSLHENLLHYRQYAAHLLSSAGSASVEGFPQVKPPHLSLQVRKIIMFIHTRTHKTSFTWKLRRVFQNSLKSKDFCRNWWDKAWFIPEVFLVFPSLHSSR